LDIWGTWHNYEIFGHPDYVNLYSGPDSKACCAVQGTNTCVILYPFLLRDLSFQKYCFSLKAFDITSAYGYSGPFYLGPRPSEECIGRFWHSLHGWAHENRVVSEFVRFSLFPETQLPYPGDRWLAGEHVVRSLNTPEPKRWMEFEHKVRKNVKTAIRNGVRIETDASGSTLNQFLEVYHRTLVRRSAHSEYYLSPQYFETLRRHLLGHFIFFHAILDGKTISTELVLLSADRIYSFLGGTLEEYFYCRPNDLLKYEIMKWGAARGKQHFVLGGGYQKEDGIFRYKLAFAPEGRRSYFLGGTVLHRGLYDDLLRHRSDYEATQGKQWQPKEPFFPAYRS
jgi:hypothetical protein